MIGTDVTTLSPKAVDAVDDVDADDAVADDDDDPGSDAGDADVVPPDPEDPPDADPAVPAEDALVVSDGGVVGPDGRDDLAGTTDDEGEAVAEAAENTMPCVAVSVFPDGSVHVTVA